MRLILAIDGGGTGTRAGLYDERGALLSESEGPPSNPLTHGRSACLDAVEQMGRGLVRSHSPSSLTVAAGIAGCGRPLVRGELAPLIAHRLQADRVLLTNDVIPILAALPVSRPVVIAVAGTGSSVMVQDQDGHITLLGGRGPVFGDSGSGYSIAVAALREAARSEDAAGGVGVLASALVEAAGVAAFADMPIWASTAGRDRIAALALVVAQVADEGDEVARACISGQAEGFASLVPMAVNRLELPPDTPVFLHGGLLLECPRFRHSFETTVRRWNPDAVIGIPEDRGHQAVLKLALRDQAVLMSEVTVAEPGSSVPIPETEQRMVSSVSLDELSAREIVEVMNAADATVADAVRRVAAPVAGVMGRVAKKLRGGGRLIYTGAGTSGRLGVLDASECPPTFGVAPDRVVGLMAGGDRALRLSSEGAEDDTQQAAVDLEGLRPPIGAADILVGLSASGTTPYVLSSIVFARARGVETALVCCNRAAEHSAHTLIALDTGPEVLPGSTRLKAGTAMKMVLNIISTGAMALAGHVFEGWMIQVRPVNAKLRRRCIRIVMALTGRDEEAAAMLLDAADGRISVAVLMDRLGLSPEEAADQLAAHGGDLRTALGNP